MTACLAGQEVTDQWYSEVKMHQFGGEPRSLSTGEVCWAIQAGLLTPLTFARHRLSPLVAVNSDGYFLHNGRR